jgi:excisionase family DNA binding protein
MTTHANEWLTVSEACAYLRITRATLYRWAGRGIIRLHRIGPRSTRVRAEDLSRLTEKRSGGNDWSELSQDSFMTDWDNPQDAVYDNWRKLYDVQHG